MKPDDRDEPHPHSDPSVDDREDAPPPEEGHDPRPDETVVAETSHVTQAIPGNPHPFAVGDRKVHKKARGMLGRGHKREDPQGGGHDGDASAHSGGRGWMSYVLNGVLALACGVGGAWAFSYYESKQGDKSQDDGSSKKDDSSKGQAKGQADPGGSSKRGDSGPETSKPTPAKEIDTLKADIRDLSTKFGTLQERFDSFAGLRGSTSRDLAALQVQMKELSRSVGEVASVPNRLQPLEEMVHRLQGQVNDQRFQRAVEKDRVRPTGEAPTVADENRKLDPAAGPSRASVASTDSDSRDDALADGMVMFKKGQYSKADEIFRKLQLARPQDARVWYFSALAHGLATGQWDGETKRFVVQGADRERAGSPTASRIDAAFADLSPAQGKNWLSAYRSQLVK